MKKTEELKEVKVWKVSVFFLFYHDGYKRRCDDRFAGGETFYQHEEDVAKRKADYEERGYKVKILSGEL